MKYFIDTVETIPEGLGFSHFGLIHLIWIALFLITTLINIFYYRKANGTKRSQWRKIVAVLLVLNELWKMFWLFVGGNYLWTYLPLHLCSINIFVIAYHAWKPNRLLDAVLYTACIPGAIAALLFPTWTELPILNFMHLHSFTVHITLAMYPIVLTAGGDIHPKVTDIPKVIAMLIIAAIPIYGVNLLLDTNFMFLMKADPGNPLYIFEQLMGSHLWGFPIIIGILMPVMFLPWYFYDKHKEKQIQK